MLSLHSCPVLCDPMDCSLPGSSVHGILQERKLEWVAISFSRRSSLFRDRTDISHVSCIGRLVLYYLFLLGSPSRKILNPKQPEAIREKVTTITGKKKKKEVIICFWLLLMVTLPTTQEKTLHMDITKWPTPKSD